ncbi:MAG: DUF4469 domain-containing protein [Spirochaetaceae bacterium]|jgi:hypothetical protein|nr:DUF4469 domain-containing protein [Spirochaetaceae bacterium]
MPRITEDTETLHESELWLFPNHLTNAEGKVGGKYVGRPKGLQVLTTRDIRVKAVKDPGDVDGMETCVKWFFDTAFFEIVDGFGVNFCDYLTLRLKVGGSFDSELEQFLREKHKLSLTCIALLKVRRILDGIRCRVMGVTGDGAVIVEVIDNGSGTTNEKLTPKGVVTIIGGKIEIAGAPDKTGLYFTAPGSPIITVKAGSNYVENKPGKIIAVIPDLPTGKSWKVQVRTQYTNGTALLKEFRIIETDFMLST